MQKPGGVTVAAILLTFLTLVGALSTVGAAVAIAVMPHAGAASQPSTLIVETVLAALFGIPTIFAACVAVGLFRGRNWARIGGVVLGCLIALSAVFFLFCMMAMMLIPQTRMQFANARIGLILADMFYLALAAFGVWLAIYLNLQRVKQAFRPNIVYVPATEAYTSSAAHNSAAAHIAVPSHSMSQASRGAGVPRIVVLTMAILILVGSLSLFGMAAAGMPVFYLGIKLQGHAAALTYIVFAVLNIGIAIGLLRRFVPAYYAALAMQVLGIASSLALLSPSIRARTIEAGTAMADRITPQQPPQIQAQMQGMMHSVQNGAVLLNAILLPLVLAFFIWALWRDLANIRASASTTSHLHP
jgi:hypothetical protein